MAVAPPYLILSAIKFRSGDLPQTRTPSCPDEKARRPA